MSHHHEQKVPAFVLVSAAALMAFTIVVAAAARSAPSATADDAPPPVAVAELRFEDRADGSVGVLDARTEREVAVLAPGGHGFERGVLRGMFRTRMLESIGTDEPFVLSREADGRLVLHDPSSGREVELRSFGRTNYESFLALLDAAQRGEREGGS